MKMFETNAKIPGGRVVIVGDTHLSSKFQGTHIDYLETCYLTMERISELVKQARDEAGQASLIILGDVFGVKERNLNDDRFLGQIFSWLTRLNKLCDGHVYSVQGNHDMGTYTTFDLVRDLGYLKNPSHVDFCTPSGDLEVRFHLVNWSAERRALELSGVADVVLGHADYTIKGVTAWYDSPDQIEVSTLDNFRGVSLIISGHIHTPKEPCSIDMGDGSSIQLFYPGSPSRVSERFRDCLYVMFEYNASTGSTDYMAEAWGLRPIDEEFLPEAEVIDEGSKDSVLDLEGVGEVIGTLANATTAEGNIIQQLQARSDVPEPVKVLAVEFLESVL